MRQHQAKAFPGEVIDQGEDAEAPAAHQCVGHQVKRPAQITTLWYGHGCPVPRAGAAAALAYGEPFLGRAGKSFL